MAVSVYTSLLTLDEAPSGTVTVQDAGTTNPRNIYTDTGLSIAATNPIPLDSAGRASQGIIYTAATAYKVIVKDSAGTTLYTRDNIDPGVPIGSGFLAIANGGTGATDASTALSNLGGATAAELADIAADVASLSGALGSSEKTHIATGTTAQRPSSPEEGDIRRNTTIPQWEGYVSGWKRFLTIDDIPTGSIVQSSYSSYTSSADLTTVIAYDDSIPQIGEGTEIISVSFTPTSATNKLRFTFRGMAGHSTGAQNLTAAIFAGGAANAVAASSARPAGADDAVPITVTHEMTSGVAVATTYTVRVGPASGGTMRMNGTSAARRLGGASAATLVIEEIRV